MTSSFEKRGVIQGLLPNGLSHYPERGVSVAPGNVASVWGYGGANGSIALLLNGNVIAKSYRDYSANGYLPEIISSIPITIKAGSSDNQLILRVFNNGYEANWVGVFLQCSIILSRSTQNIIFNNITN